jgi:hypothetical protein
MKKLKGIFFVLFCISVSITYSQSNYQSYQKSDSLRREVQKITYLLSGQDDSLSSPYYFNADFSDYEKRLENVEKLLVELSKLEEEYILLSSANISEIDFYLKLAYINIAFLNVYGNMDSYIGFIKLQNKRKYEKQVDRWTDLKNRNIQTIEKRLEKVDQLDSINYEVKIIGGILQYYKGDKEEALKQLNGVRYELMNIVNELPEIETMRENSLIAYIYSWISYIELQDGKLSEAKTNMSESRKFGTRYNPYFNRYIDNTIEKLIDANNNYYQVYHEKFNDIEYSYRYIKYRTFNLVADDSKFEELSFDQIRDSVVINPYLLAKDVSSAWDSLVRLEQEVYDFTDLAFIGEEKELYKKNMHFLEEMNSGNKGGGEDNIMAHFVHLSKMLDIFNTLQLSVAGLTELIDQNPDVLIYRVLRVKADIALFYIYKAAEDYYLSVLNYIEIDGNKFPEVLKNEIERYFEVNNEIRMEDDLKKISSLTTNYLTRMTELEFYILVRDSEKALELVQKANEKADRFAHLYDTEIGTLLDIYLSYVNFKQEKLANMEESITVLKTNEEAAEWYKMYQKRFSVIKKRYKFYDKKENKKK